MAGFLAAAGVRPGTIYFGGGLPDPATFPAERLATLLSEVLQRDAAAALTYDVTSGHAGLRESIAAYLAASDGAMIDGSAVTITWPGSSTSPFSAPVRPSRSWTQVVRPRAQTGWSQSSVQARSG